MTADELKQYPAPADDEVLVVFASRGGEPIPFHPQQNANLKYRLQKAKGLWRERLTNGNVERFDMGPEFVKTYRDRMNRLDPSVLGVFTKAEYAAALKSKAGEPAKAGE